jgi:hypothetical protein
MNQISAEPALIEQLGSLTGQTVVCDANGRALGFFSPLQNHPRVEDLQLEPPLTIAETEDLRKTRTGKPLSEILDQLGIP